jgi:hypothetical protein
LADERTELASLHAAIAKAKENGLNRTFVRPDGLSLVRHIRFRQLLAFEYERAKVNAPVWVAEISADDVFDLKTTELIRRFAGGEGKLSAAIDAKAMRAAVKRIKSEMRVLVGQPKDADKPIDLFAIHPAFKLERALEIAVAGHAEFGIADERGLTVSKRNLMARTAICRCTVVGDWIEDSASRLAARLRPDGGRDIPDGSETGKLGAAIEVSVNREKVRSFVHIENDARLMQAVALFATPGALAAASRRGLSAEQRTFCAKWFLENRDLATRLGYRVGAEALFAELEKDPGPFRARYGAAPKFAPATSRIWAREKKEDVNFEGVQPKDLIGEARHALVDLTLHSHLVSMPKRRDAFLYLGAYEGAEILHGEVVDVGAWLTKPFLTEARDAAEVQIMQGTNPLAMTAGLVTWRSADGVERQAPLFLAPVELNEATKTISRLSEFVLNWALLRRIAIEFPMLTGSKDDFDALLGDIAFASPLGAVFERVAAAINVGAPVGGKPIIRIDDVSLVGSFDSARSVLERRLNLTAFPDLVDNPVVKLLALGAKAAGKERIVEGEFDPRGRARARTKSRRSR